MAHAGGRPTDYKPRYCQDIIKFFDVPFTRERIKSVTTYKDGTVKEETEEVANNLPHLISFARKIGVTYETIREWGKVHPEFSVALKEVKQMRERMIESNALTGKFNATFSIFDAKNTLGWRDEQYLKGEGFNNIMQVIIPESYKPKNPNNRLLPHNEVHS